VSTGQTNKAKSTLDSGCRAGMTNSTPPNVYFGFPGLDARDDMGEWDCRVGLRPPRKDK